MSERPLSVLIVGSLPPPIGGTTVLLESLIAELSDRDDVSVRVVDTSGIRGGLRGSLRLPVTMARIVAGALRSDVVSSHVHLSSFHLTVPPVFLASRAFGRPLVVRLFGGKDVLEEQGPRGALVRWFARRVDMLLVETKQLIGSARAAGMNHVAWYSNSRSAAEPPAQRAKSTDGCRRFVFMSQVRRVKGIGEILAATEGIDQPISVDVYGPLCDGIRESDLDGLKFVSYEGVTAPQDVTTVLSGYDALLLPTYHDGEGYPGVVLEAFNAGLPVICTRWRALPEIVDDTCGILVTPRDVDSLREAMGRLAADPELCARLGRGAAARASRFSSAYWAERFVEYCRELVGRPCAGSAVDRGTAEGGVTIAFVGDVHLGDVPAPELDGDVADVLASADLVVANLESPLTDRPIDVAGTIGLRSSPGGASVLAGWGVGAASLGNNHMFDCGPDGYEDTKRALDEACVPAFGAGLNLAEALEPLEFSRGGLRLHLLSFVEEDTRAVLADSDSHGCAPLTRELVEERIHASSEAADAVVVVVHWGYCDYRMPSPHQAKLVEAMFQAGATAVVGHHSHVVQGVRHRAQRLVAYSLGNFAFAEYSHGGHGARLTPDNLHGAILSVSVDAHGVSGCEVRHTQLGEGTISLDGSAASEDEFARRCRAVLPGRHESNWKRLVALRLLRRAAHWMNPASWSRIGRTQLAGGRIMLREIARRDN